MYVCMGLPYRAACRPRPAPVHPGRPKSPSGSCAGGPECGRECRSPSHTYIHTYIHTLMKVGRYCYNVHLLFKNHNYVIHTYIHTYTHTHIHLLCGLTFTIPYRLHVCMLHVFMYCSASMQCNAYVYMYVCMYVCIL